MDYFALISWLGGEGGWRCNYSEIWDGGFLLVSAMEGLSIGKCQPVPQQSCIPYFCSCKNINQKGLKQVQSVQTDTHNTLLLEERTELMRLHSFPIWKTDVIVLSFWKHVALSDSQKFCFRFKASWSQEAFFHYISDFFLDQVMNIWWLGYIFPREKRSLPSRLILTRNGCLMQTKLFYIFVLIVYSISTNSPLNRGLLYSVLLFCMLKWSLPKV